MEEEIKTPDEQKHESIFNRMGWMTKLMCLFMILIFWYSASFTKEVPNVSYTNETNLQTNTTILIKHIRVNETSVVPQAPLTPTYALFESFMFAMIVFLLIKVENKPEEFITISQAIEIVKKYTKIWQNERLLPRGQVFINPDAFKLVHTIYNNQRIPFKYVIDVQIQNNELGIGGLTQHYYAEVNAKTRYFIGCTRAPRPLEREDICGRCGKFADIRVLNSDDFKNYIQIKRSFAGAR